MRNSTFALSLFLLASLNVTAADCDDMGNLLQNAFETAKVNGAGKASFDPWNVNGNARFIVGTGDAVCGDNYAILENENDLVPNKNTFISTYQNITIPAGTTNLVFRIWAAKDEKVESFINFRFSNGPLSGTVYPIEITNLYTGPGSLVEYTLSIPIPSGTTRAEVRISSEVKVAGTGGKNVYLDGGNIKSGDVTPPDDDDDDDDETTLPVELASIEARLLENNVELTWQTASEVNTSRFEVQHSANGINWNTLTEVQAAGNFAGLKNYRFLHAQPSAGINYYRLKMVDLDGTFAYSKIVNVLNTRSTLNAYLYPNPSSGNVSFGTVNALNVAVYDLSGNAVVRKNGATDKLDLSSLRTGIYMVSWSDENNQKFTQRLVISR